MTFNVATTLVLSNICLTESKVFSSSWFVMLNIATSAVKGAELKLIFKSYSCILQNYRLCSI